MRPNHSSFILRCSSLLLLFVSPALAHAEDIFFSLPLTDVIPAAKLPPTSAGRSWGEARAELFPRIVIDTPGAEAYYKTDVTDLQSYQTADLIPNARITLRLPKAGPVTGQLFFPTSDRHSQVSIPFTCTPDEKSSGPSARKDFLLAKQFYYFDLSEAHLPGAAWFRHEELAAADALGKDKRELLHIRGVRFSNEGEEFGILTGGRALAENIQLDRALVARASDKPDVDLSSLTGITLQKYDWAPLLKDLRDNPDPLAALFPADQHAIFFPSTRAFTTFIAETRRSTLPVLELSTENNSQDEHLIDRYSRQLCLPLADLDKKIPANLIASIAVTGSDPSLPTGSAVTILFESSNPDKLLLEIEMIIQDAVKSLPAVASQHMDHPIAANFTSPDRSVSVYLAKFDNAVLVTNSPQQIAVLTDVQSKKSPSLASLDEYQYFRSRYPRADKDESAFLIISDAALRRWCGPKLRIAEAHRVRAAALLAELEAANLENPELPIALPGDLALDRSDLGKLTRVNGHIHSERYNTLAFLTPADELDITKISAADAESYSRWRDTYQQNWQQYFDPIALRLSLSPQKLAADLSVCPLIENSVYKTGLFSYFKGKIPPEAADPHNALAQLVVGLDVSKPPLSEMLPGILPLGPGDKTGKIANPFRWVGNNATLYIDDDPLWQDLAKAKDKDQFLQHNTAKLPIALRIACNNPLGQVAFLASLRSFVESSSPGMLSYTPLVYNNQPYVKVTPLKPEQVGLSDMKDLAIYYIPAPDSLLITLSEPLLKRAIDRSAAASQPATQPDNQKSKIAAGENQKSPWLGQTLAVHIDANFLRLAIPFFGGENQLFQLQQQAWAPLPILNDLQRLRPNENALALYAATFAQSPVDPMGGTYSWDEKLQTYTSSTLGNPVAPKTTTQLPPALEALKSLDFGLTLDDNNLRAHATLERNP